MVQELRDGEVQTSLNPRDPRIIYLGQILEECLRQRKRGNLPAMLTDIEGDAIYYSLPPGNLAEIHRGYWPIDGTDEAIFLRTYQTPHTSDIPNLPGTFYVFNSEDHSILFTAKFAPGQGTNLRELSRLPAGTISLSEITKLTDTAKANKWMAENKP